MNATHFIRGIYPFGERGMNTSTPFGFICPRGMQKGVCTLAFLERCYCESLEVCDFLPCWCWIYSCAFRRTWLLWLPQRSGWMRPTREACPLRRGGPASQVRQSTSEVADMYSCRPLCECKNLCVRRCYMFIRYKQSMINLGAFQFVCWLACFIVCVSLVVTCCRRAPLVHFCLVPLY